MNIPRQRKGEFGYPPYERKRVIIRTAAYFLISIAVFLLGYFSTGQKENLLTIVAVLGLLPSSKSLVSVVMYFKIPRFSETVYQEISGQESSVPVIYSLYLTSYRSDFHQLFCRARRQSDRLHGVSGLQCLRLRRAHSGDPETERFQEHHCQDLS